MPLTIGKPYTGLRVAVHDGKLVFVPREGFCDGIVLNTPYIGLRASTHDGDLVYLISDQKLNAAGEMIIGKPYIGLRASTHDGDLVYLIDGKECDQTNPTLCGCTICCTLEATVQFPESLDPSPTFGAAVDATLTCAGSFVISNFHSCNDGDSPICVQADSTWSGGTGSYVSGAQTFNWETVVWVSGIETGGPAGIVFTHPWAGNITFTGNFRVFFAATQYTITEEGEEDIICCAFQWGVLVEYDFDEAQNCSGTGWGFWTTGSSSTGSDPSCPGAVMWVQSECENSENLCCPEGYTNDTPDTSYLDNVCNSSSTTSGCPFDESADPLLIEIDDDCLKLLLSDLCE